MIKAEKIEKARKIIERKKALKRVINKVFSLSERKKAKLRQGAAKTLITLATFSPITFLSSGCSDDRAGDEKNTRHISPEEAKIMEYAKNMDINEEVQSFVHDYTEENLYAFSNAPDELKKEVKDAFAGTVDFAAAEKNGWKLNVLLDDAKQNIVYASIISDTDKFSVYRFTDENGESGYYNEKGQRVEDIINNKPVNGVFKSKFGYRIHPVHKTRKLHTGVDYAAPKNTPVEAAAGGYIRFMSEASGYGKLVIVQHANGYETYYAHLNKYPNTKNFERDGKNILVNKGDIIGYVGETGVGTGNHLHFEVRLNSQPIDPMKEDYYVGQKLNNSDMLAFNQHIASVRSHHPEAFKHEALLAMSDNPHKLETAVRKDINGKGNVEALDYLYKYRGDRATFLDTKTVLGQSNHNWHAVAHKNTIDMAHVFRYHKTNG